jgi:hypothetical protein
MNAPLESGPFTDTPVKIRASTFETIGHQNAQAAKIKSKCTTGDYRRVRRWEHEGVLDKMQNRLDHNPQTSRIRRQTVEHPFGTLKLWMGSTHFLTKTIEKVSTEMSLHVLAYNMKRMLAIHGTLGLIRAI